MTATGAALLRAEEEARALLRTVSEELEATGRPAVEARGQLIRPVVALAGVTAAQPQGFADAVAAIQLAHEASLVHDDIVDGARQRRGAPSVVASRGIGRALVHGDQLLVTSYSLASRTGSLPFATAFADAVEQTVAGEVRQASVAGRRIDARTQLEIIERKSGALFGIALAAAALLEDRPDAAALRDLGRRLGVVYQRVDDLLDYLPQAATGKPALADYRQRHWTWPLDLLEATDFDGDASEVAGRLRAVGADGRSPLDRARERLDDDIADLRGDLRERLGATPLDALLDRWRSVVRIPVQAPAQPMIWPAAPGPEEWVETLSRGSRSFRFAARLFPPADRQRVAGVYTFCRYTDDLVDRADDLAVDAIERRLEAWAVLARSAYDGEQTGVAMLDGVMREAAAARVPFRYVAELIEGMRMDLRPRAYASLADLRAYSYRVASVVGLWLTELHDVRDPAVLERAATLGHAMQLTNILRDVGEDLDAGRLYLPTDLLAEHGLDRAALEAMRAGAAVHPAWPGFLESMMSIADAWYREAFAAIPALPRSFQRPVAVAAHVYRGIHDAIRANDYDNLRRRAFTSKADKVRLATGALVELRRARRRGLFRPPVRPGHTDVAVDGASGARAR